MADRNSTHTRGLTGRLAKKLLMPVVAASVSAAAGYAGKKAPQLIEDRLMPKLREATADHSVGDLADGLAERAKAVVGKENAEGGRPAKRLSPSQRETRRRQRAEHREARRTGSGAKED